MQWSRAREWAGMIVGAEGWRVVLMMEVGYDVVAGVGRVWMRRGYGCDGEGM